MMTRPPSTRADHDRFCRLEGWRQVGDARGRTGTHHVRYELDLPDGRVLRTRISHPPDRSTYGASIWAHILRDQLQIDESQFWACVRDGVQPDRGMPKPPAEALSADLVHLLVHRVGVPDREVVEMTREQAVERVNRYWTEGA